MIMNLFRNTLIKQNIFIINIFNNLYYFLTNVNAILKQFFETYLRTEQSIFHFRK